MSAAENERRHGIGYRWPPAPAGWNEDTMASRHSQARAGAAAMRSRAFEQRVFGETWSTTQIHPGKVQAIGQTPVVPGDSRYVAAWPEERELGCPAWPKP